MSQWRNQKRGHRCAVLFVTFWISLPSQISLLDFHSLAEESVALLTIPVSGALLSAMCW